MSEPTHRSSFVEGYLIWFFLTGIFFIPITIAIVATDTVQGKTDWKEGYALILGAAIGILLTLIAAFVLERKSR